MSKARAEASSVGVPVTAERQGERWGSRGGLEREPRHQARPPTWLAVLRLSLTRVPTRGRRGSTWGLVSAHLGAPARRPPPWKDGGARAGAVTGPPGLVSEGGATGVGPGGPCERPTRANTPRAHRPRTRTSDEDRAASDPTRTFRPRSLMAVGERREGTSGRAPQWAGGDPGGSARRCRTPRTCGGRRPPRLAGAERPPRRRSDRPGRRGDAVLGGDPRTQRLDERPTAPPTVPRLLGQSSGRRLTLPLGKHRQVGRLQQMAGHDLRHAPRERQGDRPGDGSR